MVVPRLIVLSDALDLMGDGLLRCSFKNARQDLSFFSDHTYVSSSHIGRGGKHVTKATTQFHNTLTTRSKGTYIYTE